MRAPIIVRPIVDVKDMTKKYAVICANPRYITLNGTALDPVLYVEDTFDTLEQAQRYADYLRMVDPTFEDLDVHALYSILSEDIH